jgi:uncharacterized protein with ParB-like and HNH nuclease domain
MRADKNKLFSREFLYGGEIEFVIPVYQRNYSWEIEQCEKLLDDIRKLYEDERKGHFLGSIVAKSEMDVKRNIKYTIIDGQQRLTSIFLMIKAFLRVYGEKLEILDKFVKRDLEETLADPRNKDNKLRLYPVKNDSSVFEKIMFDKNIEMDKESRMAINFQYFVKYFQDFSKLDIIEYYAALQKLDIVFMSLEEYDDAQIIFESINSTGLNLTQTDLIRNFLLMAENSETQKKLFENYWDKFEKILGIEELNEFFKYFTTYKSTVFTKEENIYNSYKEYFYDCEYITKEEAFKELEEYIEIYLRIIKPYSETRIFYEKEINFYLYEILEMKNNTVRPALFYVFDYALKNELTIIEVKKVVKLLDSFLLRRNVMGAASNSLQKIFLSITNQVKNLLKKVKDISFYDAFCYQLVHLNNAESNNMPSYDDLIARGSTYNLYSSRRHVARLVLLGIENQNNKHKINMENLSIEHIIPQSLTSEWINVLGQNSKNHKQFVHRLGNLTLTAYNSELSNNPIQRKIEIINETRHLRMNTELQDIEKFTYDELNQRTLSIIEKIIEIWSYEPLSKEKIELFEKSLSEKMVPEEIERKNLKEYFKKWTDIKWERDFFNLYKQALELVDLPVHDRSVATTLNKQMSIALHLNSRYLIVSHRSSLKNTIAFILTLDFEEQLEKYNCTYKGYFSNRNQEKEALYIELEYKDLTQLDKEFLDNWKRAIIEEKQRGSRNSMRTCQNNIIYVRSKNGGIVDEFV